MKFTKEYLLDLLDGEVGDGVVMEDDVSHKTRWSLCYRMVFKHEDKFYVTRYSIGATESQDESPYEYEDDEIECKEVFPKEVTVTVYE
jgi:hypothetical protein